jgi:hypothetical protein
MRVTTRNFEDHARSFMAAKTRKESGELEMKELKRPFVAFLKRYGNRPETGKKSLAFATAVYRAMASFGETTTVEVEAVEAFRAAFNRRGRGVSFSEIFEERTEYVAMPGGALAVKQLPKELQKLYQRSRGSKPLQPSLKVEKVAA